MNEEIRILKIATCPSLSGRSTLTYHIGCQGKEVYIRIVENSAPGLFSKEWLSLPSIKVAENAAFAASSLHELFKGKSINTAGFMLAVLKHEGLVKNSEDKIRSYKGADSSAFNEAIKELIDSGVSLSDTHQPHPAKAAKPKTVRNIKTPKMAD